MLSCTSQDRSRDKKSVFQFSQSFSNKHQSSFSHIPLPLKEEIGTLSLVSALFRPSSRYQKQIGAPGTKSHHYGVLNWNCFTLGDVKSGQYYIQLEQFTLAFWGWQRRIVITRVLLRHYHWICTLISLVHICILFTVQPLITYTSWLPVQEYFTICSSWRRGIGFSNKPCLIFSTMTAWNSLHNLLSGSRRRTEEA